MASIDLILEANGGVHKNSATRRNGFSSVFGWPPIRPWLATNPSYPRSATSFFAYLQKGIEIPTTIIDGSEHVVRLAAIGTEQACARGPTP